MSTNNNLNFQISFDYYKSCNNIFIFYNAFVFGFRVVFIIALTVQSSLVTNASKKYDPLSA